MKPLPSLIAITASLTLAAAPSELPAQDDLEDLSISTDLEEITHRHSPAG